MSVHVLHPGDVVFAQSGDRLETLLGSCVAIILTDPRRTVGVMCHIVHSGASHVNQDPGTSHAEPALHAMFNLLRSHGINPMMCEAYLYGGGNMFPGLFKHNHVGQNNSNWATQTLAELGIKVIHCDVGGTTYRRLGWTIGPDAPQVTAVEV